MQVMNTHLSRKSSAISQLLGKMLSANVILGDQRKNLGIPQLLVRIWPVTMAPSRASLPAVLTGDLV